MTATATARKPRTRTIPVAQRTAEWLDARERGIGASQAAAALGMSEWQSRIGLWAEKLKLVPPQPESLPMRIGSALEPLIAQLYTEQTGVKVRRVNHLRQHPVHDFMLASIDRRAGRRLVELKYSHRGAGYGEPGTDEVPNEVLVQVLHQMAVMDVDEADVAVVVGGARDVRIYPVRRDPGTEAAIVEREAEFWDHVLSRTEPPIVGDDADLEALAAMYPQDDGEQLQEASDSPVGRALAALGLATANEKAAAARKGELRAQIEAHMATATGLVVPGVGKVTWRTPTASTVVHWDRVAAAYREAIERELAMVDAGDMSETALPSRDDLAAIESLNTETKANSRRFTPTFEED